MAIIELRNETELQFVDISSEKWRCYLWDTDGDEYWIENPQWLAITGNGHRILDGDEKSYYIPFGWRALKWEVKKGAPHFVR